MRILIAIDQTQASLACIEVAARHTWPSGTQFGLITSTKPNPLDIHGEAQIAAAQNMQSLANDLRRRASGPLVGADCLVGNPAEIVLNMAGEWHSSLIILGSHNKSNLASLVLGSVSKEVLEYAPCSVLIARSPSPDSAHGFRKILVAVDGSPMSECSVSWLGSHPWAANSEFAFICVAPALAGPSAKTNKEKEAVEQAARAEVERKVVAAMTDTISRCAPWVLQYPYSVIVEYGHPTEKILATAEARGIDLIVIGSHGRSGAELLLLGSVSQAVASTASCSVLVVKRLEDIHEFEEGSAAKQSTDFAPHISPPIR